jgi:hypothetical protein
MWRTNEMQNVKLSDCVATNDGTFQIPVKQNDSRGQRTSISSSACKHAFSCQMTTDSLTSLRSRQSYVRHVTCDTLRLVTRQPLMLQLLI